MLQVRESSATRAGKEPTTIISSMDSSFKAAFENPLQVPKDVSANLNQMQSGSQYLFSLLCVLRISASL